MAKDDGVVLDIREEAADALVKRLSLYRLRANADITLDSSAFVVAGTGLADPRSPQLPQRTIASDKPAADGTTRQAEPEISHGIPAFGRDYGEAEVFPTDVNLDLYGGIAWKKGCFIGQEVLSRMKRRGTIRKAHCRRGLCIYRSCKGATSSQRAMFRWEISRRLRARTRWPFSGSTGWTPPVKRQPSTAKP